MTVTSRNHRAAIFDLDGTLLDTLHDIGALMNAALVDLGLPPHPIDAYPRFVGSGLEALARRATIDYDVDLPRLIEDFRARYRAVPVRHSRPFAGIEPLLDTLAERNMVLAVLSNKPHGLTVTITAQLLGDRFARVWGHRDRFPRKPDPTSAKALLAELRLDAEDCLYIGDTDIDMQTATATGMFPVGVSWGFRPTEELVAAGAKTILEEPNELLALCG